MSYLIVALVVLGGLSAVAWPLLRRNRQDDETVRDDAVLERRIAEYRAALTAETLCSRCLRANPTDARYCADCGVALRALEESRSD